MKQKAVERRSTRKEIAKSLMKKSVSSKWRSQASLTEKRTTQALLLLRRINRKASTTHRIDHFSFGKKTD